MLEAVIHSLRFLDHADLDRVHVRQLHNGCGRTATWILGCIPDPLGRNVVQLERLRHLIAENAATAAWGASSRAATAA